MSTPEAIRSCLDVLERGARRMAEAAKREAILKAEMQAAIAASKPVVIPQQQHNPKYRFWAAEEQSRFIALRKEGKTMREIAHELGRNYYSVVHFGVKLKAWGNLPILTHENIRNGRRIRNRPCA